MSTNVLRDPTLVMEMQTVRIPMVRSTANAKSVLLVMGCCAKVFLKAFKNVKDLYLLTCKLNFKHIEKFWNQLAYLVIIL